MANTALHCYECVLSQKPTGDNRIVIQEGYSLCVTHMAQGVRRRLP